ncbi:LLM class flavin-dependent oxidoreductase [Knoellia subterranea]|uniref:LLM class flavin-dependent oxidoreductase n=1 Tax=Knoellia subterranea TaxID=184882 RepID=UPI00055CEC30|nr:LLM class flavin-dependent oxidoreductase [Knoellia subterranea]
MRHGISILPDLPWREAGSRWRAVEEMGFAHAWVYDHLVWGGLPDSTWFPAVPTLAAAAGVTSTIGLGTFVTSPNFRHPYVFARDVFALDDLSAGRFICGLGTGGDLDSAVLGESHTVKARVDRFHEYVPLLDRLLREDHVDHEGDWYAVRDARTLPGPVRDRVPFIIAANGPRSLRLAARFGQGWVTTGPGGVETLDEWWSGVAGLASRLSDLPGTDSMDRYLLLDASPQFSLESVGVYEEMTGRAAELGFTDTITHWPRSGSPYAGSEATLDEVASRFVSGGDTGTGGGCAPEAK